MVTAFEPWPEATRGPDSLDALRHEIARVDDQLVALLAERQALARRVGTVKRVLGLPIADPAREAAVVRRAAEQARVAGLPEEPTRELFRRMMAMARGEQAQSHPRHAAAATPIAPHTDTPPPPTPRSPPAPRTCHAVPAE